MIKAIQMQNFLKRMLGMVVMTLGGLCALISIVGYFSEERGLAIFFTILGVILLGIGFRWRQTGKETLQVLSDQQLDAPSPSVPSRIDGSGPSQKQLGYLKGLGYRGAAPATLQEASHLIDAIKGGMTSEQAETLQRDWRYWEEFVDHTRFMLATYRKRKDIIVDVLDVYDVEEIHKGVIQLLVSEPKLVRDRYVGDYLEWDHDHTLPVDKLLSHEPLHDNFDNEPLAVYKRVVAKELKKAKKNYR